MGHRGKESVYSFQTSLSCFQSALDSVERMGQAFTEADLTLSPYLMGCWLYWGEGWVCFPALCSLGNWTVVSPSKEQF